MECNITGIYIHFLNNIVPLRSLCIKLQEDLFSSLSTNGFKFSLLGEKPNSFNSDAWNSSHELNIYSIFIIPSRGERAKNESELLAWFSSFVTAVIKCCNWSDLFYFKKWGEKQHVVQLTGCLMLDNEKCYRNYLSFKQILPLRWQSLLKRNSAALMKSLDRMDLLKTTRWGKELVLVHVSDWSWFIDHEEWFYFYLSLQYTHPHHG